MNAFNKEYFFILEPEDERLPFLTPDEDTVAKQYDWEIMPLGSKPLIFYNSGYERQKRKRITPISPPPDVLFDGSNLVVIRRIADRLWDLEIPYLAIQPAVYIDHKDNWYENYWFLTFTSKFDCWDREHSTFNPKPSGMDAVAHKVDVYSGDNLQPMYDVYTYSLDENLLKKTPLAERRLFEMGGTSLGFVVAHKSIVDLFKVKGVDIVPITDYGVSYP